LFNTPFTVNSNTTVHQDKIKPMQMHSNLDQHILVFSKWPMLGPYGDSLTP